MTLSENQRKKHYVDPEVQNAILRQVAYLWLLGAAIYTYIVFVYRIMPIWFSSGTPSLGEIWYHLAPMVLSAAALFPLMMSSAIRFSHRFVGPMVQFRQVLRQLASGDNVAPIQLRRNDFWRDVADELNQVSERFDELSSREPEREEVLIEC